MSLLDSEIEVIDKVSIKELIIEWLKKYNIKNYKINNDLTININEDVWLNKYPESQLPNHIQFNKAIGYFNIANSQIETLRGCPKIVKGNFNCSWCKNLKTLEGAPKKVEGYFSCSNCSKLKTLEGAPEIVNSGFNCSDCENLEFLKGAPETVKCGFNCYGCKNLKITESYYKKYKITK